MHSTICHSVDRTHLITTAHISMPPPPQLQQSRPSSHREGMRAPCTWEGPRLVLRTTRGAGGRDPLNLTIEGSWPGAQACTADGLGHAQTKNRRKQKNRRVALAMRTKSSPDANPSSPAPYKKRCHEHVHAHARGHRRSSVLRVNTQFGHGEPMPDRCAEPS